MATEIKYLTTFALCASLTLATVSIHMMSLLFLRKKLGHLAVSDAFTDHAVRETLFVSAMVTALSLVHFTEIMVWALAFLGLGGISTFTDAVYFSMTMYTTVGPDQVEISHRYRGVAGFESLLGPIMIAWSTAFLFNFITVIRTHGHHQ